MMKYYINFGVYGLFVLRSEGLHSCARFGARMDESCTYVGSGNYMRTLHGTISPSANSTLEWSFGQHFRVGERPPHVQPCAKREIVIIRGCFNSSREELSWTARLELERTKNASFLH